MKLKKFITFTLASIMALSVPLTTMADDVDLSDIGVPVYERAQVQRKNVVINATPTDIPDELKDIVIRTYPEGKMKAFLLSFDDGGGNGATANDYHILVPLFTENNLNAAFNLNLRDDHKTQGPLLRIPESGKSVWGGGWTSQSFLDQVLPQYGGFEVSNHGLNHKTASNLSKDNLRREIGDCKNLLEDMFDKEVAGYAYAGGSNSPDSEPAPGAWRNAYLKYIGVRYARNAPTKNYIYADTAAKLYYTVPKNFYSWDPTIHVTQPRPLGSGIAVSNLDIFNYYLNDLDASTDMKVFFGWGHSTDISSADYSNYTGVNPNGNYANVAEICRIAGENLDVLWNPTPLDYVDYINAMWNTTLELNDDGDIVATNTSGAEDVWFKIDGKNVKVPYGKVATIGTDGTIKSIEQGEIITNNDYIAPPPVPATPEPNPNGTVDEENLVTVYGEVDSANAGDTVTLIMMKNTAELETLTNSDIGHIAEATVANDGTYSFKFKFGGFTFDENDKVLNYKVMLNINGQDATPSITKAIVEKPLMPVRVELSLEDSIATALFTVEEDAQVTSSTYNLILAFYNEANNLIDVKFANKKNITAGGMTDSIGVPVPTGTKTVKAFVWDSVEKQIPLADFDMATVK